MLLDNTSTVDANNLPIRESLANQSQRLSIKVGLVIGRTEHGTVDDKEIGIGGRQPVTAFVVDGPWHGQLHQSIGLTFESPEGRQLRFHQLQVLILLVLRVLATYI